MADATPETKEAHFAAAKAAVAAEATASVGSFAEADEETQNATVGDVLGTYNTLDADVENSAALGDMFDALLGRGTQGRRRRLSGIWGRRLEDEVPTDTPADIDVSACVGGSPSLEDLNWTRNGAVFFMLTIMTTIGYGTFSPSTALGMAMVITCGSISIVVFGWCIGPLQSGLDRLIERAPRLY